MKTFTAYADAYQSIRAIEIKVVNGVATKEECAAYRKFLESDIHKEQVKRDLDATPDLWSCMTTIGAVAAAG